MSDSLRPHESQHTRPPCPSPTPEVHSNSCLLSRWCHPAISSSVVLFSSCPQSFPASESFPMSQLFTWGGQSIGVSALASFLPKNPQDWSPLEWTGWISLQSKGLSWDYLDERHSYCQETHSSGETVIQLEDAACDRRMHIMPCRAQRSSLIQTQEEWLMKEDLEQYFSFSLYVFIWLVLVLACRI